MGLIPSRALGNVIIQHLEVLPIGNQMYYGRDRMRKIGQYLISVINIYIIEATRGKLDICEVKSASRGL